MQTIVVGYGGSEPAERALARAAELAEALSARLVVVSVSNEGRMPVTVAVREPETAFVPSPVGGPMGTGEAMGPLGAEPQRVPEPRELAQHALERARMTLARRRIEADYVAEVGAPAEKLLEIAEERNADLIVVGSGHHGLLERLLARPVDEAIARRASRDVLLVH
jgi:nucleotide-binding universal stress UspA family protein